MQALLGIQRISSGFYRLGLRPLGKLFGGLNCFFQLFLSWNSEGGQRDCLCLWRIGLVVHGRAEIGQGCVIGQALPLAGDPKVEVPRTKQRLSRFGLPDPGSGHHW